MSRLHLALPLAALMCASTASAADLPNKEALNEAIRSYILENPGVIVEALEKLERQEREAREKAAADALANRHDDIFNHPMTPVTGNKDGDITVVEFFDYQCGYCKRTMQSVLDIQEEDPKVRVVWKELPILGPASDYAARAAMAAKKQGKYLDFHIAIMGSRGPLTPDSIMKHASKVGLDLDRLKEDMKDPEIDKYLRDTLQLAQELGINGTPGFIIGERLVPGAISKDQMKQIIAEARGAS